MTVQGLMAAIGAPTLVGLGVAVTSRLTAYPAIASQGARYLVGAVILLVVFRGRVRPRTRPTIYDLLVLLVLSAVGLALFSVAVVEALSDASVAGVGVIVGCVPIILAILGAFVERRRPEQLVIIAAVIVTLGSLLVNDIGGLGVKGFLFAVLAMLCDATFSLLSVGLVRKFGTIPTAFGTTLIAGIGMLAIAPIGGGIPSPTVPEVIVIGYLALTVSAASFVLWYSGLAILGVARAGLCVSMIPIGALIGEVLLVTRSVSWEAIVGVIIVFGGLVLGSMGARSRLESEDGLDLNGGSER